MRIRNLVPGLLLLSVLAAAHEDYPFEFLQPTRTDAQFVDQSFGSILGRAPTPSERAEWLDTLTRGSRRWYVFRTLLDSAAYRSQATDEQALVLAFSAMLQRPPTNEELSSFSASLQSGATRSDAFRALVMSRDFARRDINPFFLMDNVDLPLHPSLVPQLPALIEAARQGSVEVFVEAAAAPQPPVEAAGAATALGDLTQLSGSARQSVYQEYRGYLHAHSYLSIDARNTGGTPQEAWAMARDQAHLNYMGITDHAEFLGNGRWDELQAAAQQVDQPGVFVALPGFEHSNPAMGHYCVMNTTEFRSALEKTTVSAFYDWLETQPQAIATFNHPGSYDYLGIEFNHFALRPSVVPMLVANEVMHRSLDQYAVGYDGQLSFLDEAILKGWRVGSVQAQDNHSKNYGIADDTRTVVFAEDLTQEGILDAYRKRRTYASEDRNLYLTFSTSEGHEMGSVLDRSARTFVVGLDDPDTETFTKIDVYEDGEITRTQTLSTTSGTWSFDVPAASRDRHLYVRVTQQDGDRAQSSPIWLTTAATGTVAVR
jgi:hypothetical protein